MFDRGLVIGRIKGIPVRAHFTLVILFPYITFVAASEFSALAQALGVPRQDLGMPPLAWGMALAIGLFAAIVVHELAHSLVAMRHGAKVRAITLMMLGGISQIEDDVPPEREAWMAFAGPLASFGVAALSYAMVYAVPKGFSGTVVALLVFAMINAVIAVFNLLPAFPMDGGRVLRGLLTRFIGRERLTRVATSLGKVMAVGFFIVGLAGFNAVLILVALFVYVGASAEQVRASTRGYFRGVRVVEVMSDRLGDARADERVDEVASRLIRNNQSGARVVERDGEVDPRGHTVGIVTAGDLVRRSEGGRAAATVASAMHTEFPRVHVTDDATRTLDAFANEETSVVAVVDGAEHVVGIVTPSEMQRAVSLIHATGRRPALPRV